MCLTIQVKPFAFHLKKEIRNAQGIINKKEGWLIQISDELNNFGWGEVSTFKSSELKLCENLLKQISGQCSRSFLDKKKQDWPSPLIFGIYSALAELDGLIGGKNQKEWLYPPQSAILIPDITSNFHKIDQILKDSLKQEKSLTFKVKVAIQSPTKEKEILDHLLSLLPMSSRLRVDANGGWTRNQANFWVHNLSKESKVEWVEQPLPAGDIEGLYQLSKEMPIALDESLTQYPELRNEWPNWQIRRPSLEGDPTYLLKELEAGKGFRNISTSFETGIGLRWVNHFAALQNKGATPVAPGLATNWCPKSDLFSNDPKIVWEAV